MHTNDLNARIHSALSTLVNLMLAAEQAEGRECQGMDVELDIQPAGKRVERWRITVKREPIGSN